MATINQILHRKNDSGTYDDIYLKANLANVTGTLGVSNGGTGATTADGALAAIGAGKVAKKVSITLSGTWSESNGLYSQVVTVSGGNAKHQVSLQPTAEQLAALKATGMSSLQIDNNNGTFTAIAAYGKNDTAITLQATLVEVE